MIRNEMHEIISNATSTEEKSVTEGKMSTDRRGTTHKLDRTNGEHGMSLFQLCACLFIGHRGGIRGVCSHHRLLYEGATGAHLQEHGRTCNSIGRTLSSDLSAHPSASQPTKTTYPPTRHHKEHTPIHMRTETSARRRRRCISKALNRG